MLACRPLPGSLRAMARVVLWATAITIAGSGCVAPTHSVQAPSTGASPSTKSSESGASRSTDGQSTPETDCLPSGSTARANGTQGTTDDDADPEHTVDDGFEAPASAQASTAPLPFADLDDAQLSAKLSKDISALGPMAIGHAHGGVLVAGVQMPQGANWELVSPSLAWGTQETVDALAHAIDAVAAKFPSTPKAFIGNLSAKYGGHLPPHVSHQSGRDVDLGYYHVEGHHRWYAAATAANLDKARSWHLVRTLIAESDVDLVLMDLSVQRILKAYAREIGEDPAWLDQVFQVGGKSTRPVIFHAKGHATHLHVRFYSPVAQELGRRAYRMLLARHLITPPTLFITHTTKQGETLSHLALRYKVSADAIKKANGMHNDILKLNKPMKIPQTGGVPMPAKLALPARRTPPPIATAQNGTPGKTWDGEPCKRAAVTDPTRSGG